MDFMRAPVDASYRVFGKPAVFTDRDEQAHECVIIIDYDMTAWGELGTINNESLAVNVRRNELSERPKRGEKFESEGSTFIVEKLLQIREFEWVLECVES